MSKYIKPYLEILDMGDVITTSGVDINDELNEDTHDDIW